MEARQDASKDAGGAAGERTARMLSVALLTLFALLALRQARAVSLVLPETLLLPAGRTIVQKGTFRLDPGHPPFVKAYVAWPLSFFKPHMLYNNRWDEGKAQEFGWFFVAVNFFKYRLYFFTGRLLVLGLGVFLGYHAFSLSRRLYGDRGALLSLALYSFSPLCIAHSAVVSTEIALSLFGFLSIYYLMGLLTGRPKTTFSMYLIASSLAALSDFRALALVPAHLFVAGVALANGKAFSEKKVSPWRIAAAALAAAGAVLISVNAGYGFEGTLRPLGSFDLGGSFLGEVRKAFPNVPSLLPRYYLEGLDRQLEAIQTGGRYYFNGEVSRLGWPSYLIWAWLFREPAGQIAALALAVGSCFLRRPSREEWMVLGPAVLWMTIFSFSIRRDDGFRHALPALPLVFTFAGRLAWSPSALKAGAVFAAIALASVAAAGPDLLSYRNLPARAVDPGNVRFAGADLDWGQHLPVLAEYRRKHGLGAMKLALTGWDEPKAYGIHYEALGCRPEPGIIAVSRNVLLGLDESGRWPKDCFRWLDRWRPETRLKNAVYVYYISPNMIPVGER